MIEIKPEWKKENNINPKPISKLLKAMLTVALFLFSMDFGMIKYTSFKQKIVHKLSSLILITLFTVSMFVMGFSGQIMNISIWQIRYIIKFFANFLVLILTSENKTFCSYLHKLSLIDAKIGVDCNSFKLEMKILIFCLSSIAYKTITSIIYCIGFNECTNSVWIYILFLILYVSLDVPLIILFFIFFAARCRLIFLRKFIGSAKCEPKCFQYLYKSLVDSTEIIKKAFDPMFYITLLSDGPCVMLVIYVIIQEITVGSRSLAVYAAQSGMVLSTFSIIFVPVIAAGSLSMEVNKIKICLHNKLLEETDPQKEQEIQKLINYVDARPFKFNVLGVIPMDASLPLSVINLCVTYVIVLLQLTHLY